MLDCEHNIYEGNPSSLCVMLAQDLYKEVLFHSRWNQDLIPWNLYELKIYKNINLNLLRPQQVKFHGKIAGIAAFRKAKPNANASRGIL